VHRELVLGDRPGVRGKRLGPATATTPSAGRRGRARGVVWLDAGPVDLERFDSTESSLGTVTVGGLSQMASSEDAVALLDPRDREEGQSTGLLGGVPPRPLLPIASPTPVSGGGCSD
jgi:hypothetical protein